MMPFYRFGTGFMHIKMANTKRHPAPRQCRAPHVFTPGGQSGICAAMATLLCDAPVGDGTCDMPICPEHAIKIGPDLHLCPKHADARAETAEMF